MQVERVNLEPGHGIRTSAGYTAGRRTLHSGEARVVPV